MFTSNFERTQFLVEKGVVQEKNERLRNKNGSFGEMKKNIVFY